MRVHSIQSATGTKVHDQDLYMDILGRGKAESSARILQQLDIIIIARKPKRD